VVTEDGGLGVPESVGDPLPFFRVEDNAGVVVEEHMVVVEDATVLSDRIEKPAERGERFTVERVGMGGGHHIWKGHVDTRMDGEGGLDEMTLSGDTSVWEVTGGKVSNWTLSVADTGLPVTPIEAVKGGDREANAKTMRELLGGAGGPVRDYVLLNSAGVFLVGDLVTNIRDGVQLAAQTLDSGAAKDRLESMIEVSQAGG